MVLGREIVSLYNGKAAAKAAAEKWEKMFSKREVSGADLPELKVPKKILAVDLVLKSGVAKSKSEAWRLIVQGGLKVNDKAVSNPKQELALKRGEIAKIGKKKFFQLI